MTVVHMRLEPNQSYSMLIITNSSYLKSKFSTHLERMLTSVFSR